MPPAFNLSQDQTLQFDLSRFITHLTQRRRAPLTRNATATRSATFQSPTALASCECVQRREKPPKLARHKRRRPEAPASAPTPIDCQLLKSRRLSPYRSSSRKEARLYIEFRPRERGATSHECRASAIDAREAGRQASAPIILPSPA